MSTKEQLLAVLRSAADAGAWSWLSQAISTAAAGDRHQLLLAYTAMSQRLGNTPLNAPAALSHGLMLDAWTREDAARAVLLLERAEGERSGDFGADATSCYEEGDER